MTDFGKKFYTALGVLMLILYVMYFLLIKINLSFFEIIEPDTPAVRFFALFIAWGCFNAAVTVFAAVRATRFYRTRALKTYPANEFAFYRNFMLAFSLLPIGFAVFINKSIAPTFDAALKEGIHKISVMGYSDEYYSTLRTQVNAAYGRILKFKTAGLIVGCAVQAAALFFAAPGLVTVYQTPNKNTPLQRRSKR